VAPGLAQNRPSKKVNPTSPKAKTFKKTVPILNIFGECQFFLKISEIL